MTCSPKPSAALMCGFVTDAGIRCNLADGHYGKHHTLDVFGKSDALPDQPEPIDGPGRSAAEKMAALRAVAQDCRLLALQFTQLRERRDRLALECVDAGETWREVAEAAGFENPYIAELKRRRDASE